MTWLSLPAVLLLASAFISGKLLRISSVREHRGSCGIFRDRNADSLPSMFYKYIPILPMSPRHYTSTKVDKCLCKDIFPTDDNSLTYHHAGPLQ